MDVVTEQDRARRKRELADQDKAHEKGEKAKRRQNRGFVQVYPKGFDRLKELMDKSTLAAKIYLFLSQHMDETSGAVVVSQELLAEEMGVTTRSIRTATSLLEELGAVIRIKLGGAAVYAYCLDPNEVWKSFDGHKRYAAFKTRTLARKQDNADIRRKLKLMLHGNDAEIPDDPSPSADR